MDDRNHDKQRDSDVSNRREFFTDLGKLSAVVVGGILLGTGAARFSYAADKSKPKGKSGVMKSKRKGGSKQSKTPGLFQDNWNIQKRKGRKQ